MRKQELAKEILLGIEAMGAAAGVIMTLAVAPGLAPGIKPLVRWYQNRDKYGRYRVRKTFAQLRRERLIDIAETEDGKTRVTLTEQGRKKVLAYRLDDLQIDPMKRWDKKWRMVVFDIPEHKKKARNALREKLEALGFHRLQKSVWLHPFECRSEIDFLTEVFGVSPYLRMASVSQFDGEEHVKEKFDLRSQN